MGATHRILAAALAAGAATLGLAGCGGHRSSADAPLVRPASTHTDTGPYADLTGRQLMDRAMTAMKAAPSMTIDLRTTDDNGGAVHFTSALTKSGLCAAAATADGDKLQVIRTHSTYYLKADGAFWRTQGGKNGEAMARLLAGKWLKMPQKQGQNFAELCDLGMILDQISQGASSGTYTKGGPTTAAGRPAVSVVERDTDGTTTDILVAASGTPYILRAFTPDDTSNSASFSGFGTSPHISAPPAGQTIDVSAFGNPDISI
ncbi:hypothetical protein [Streptomyces sp. NPDC020917]|uniref:hypothetical protein n=1 Tax=Streptomyces sp. NPDC020917 TaxID=3365102 RepID=UPI0037A6215C